MKRVGILRGGKENYDMSLWQGGKLISYLQENLADKYKPIDILVDSDGVWHISGLPSRAGELLHRVDLVWNVAHHSFSKILLDFSIPQIGMPRNLSHLNHEIWKKEAESLGLKVPRRIILSAPLVGETHYAIRRAKEVHEKLGPPWIVRGNSPHMGPVRGREGSQRPSASFGMGVHVANTFNELVDAIEDGVSHGQGIVVEELISGQKEEAHTVSGYRGEGVYAFPGDGSEAAKKLHQHLGAKHYLKSEFVVSPRRGIYLTELSFVPDLRESSSLCNLCAKIGAKTGDVIEHILETGL